GDVPRLRTLSCRGALFPDADDALGRGAAVDRVALRRAGPAGDARQRLRRPAAAALLSAAAESLAEMASSSLLSAIGGLPAATTRAVVEATDIHKSFGKLPVLKGVSLTVRRGEVVVIVGASGSGKTTLIRCLNHLEKVDQGRVMVNGHLIGYRERNGRLVEDRERNIAR